MKFFGLKRNEKEKKPPKTAVRGGECSTFNFHKAELTVMYRLIHS